MPLFVWLKCNGGGYEPQIWHDQHAGMMSDQRLASKFEISEVEAARKDLDALAAKYPPPADVDEPKTKLVVAS